MKTCPNDPVCFTGENGTYFGQNVLTKREYFAAMAMQGNVSYMADWNVIDPEIVAKKSIRQADALIKELNKNEDT